MDKITNFNSTLSNKYDDLKHIYLNLHQDLNRKEIAMIFSDDFLKSLNNWQNGWGDNQTLRNNFAIELLKNCKDLPAKYKKITVPCFRKRFLHKEELLAIIMADDKDEGVVSWTTDEKYAERFKGLLKANAVSGAIFKINPEYENVVVNVVNLWSDEEFVRSVEDYAKREPENTKALLHFKANQSEVILKSHLRGSDIISLTGLASPFDILCDQAGIADEIRDDIFKKLIDNGEYINEPSYTPPGSAQAVLSRVIEKFNKRIIELSQAT